MEKEAIGKSCVCPNSKLSLGIIQLDGYNDESCLYIIKLPPWASRTATSSA